MQLYRLCFEKKVFQIAGINGGPSKRIGGVGAPAYLNVEGFKLCLNSHTPSSGSHSGYCLPKVKPELCKQDAWDKLLDVFEGDCPEGGK